MAWTEAQRDALKAAIARGTLTTEYDGRRVTYRSLNEMKEILRLMEAEIAAATGTAAPRQIRHYSRRGL